MDSYLANIASLARCESTGPVSKVYTQLLVLLGGGGGFTRMAHGGRKPDHWNHVLEGDNRKLVASCLSPFAFCLGMIGHTPL